MAVRKKMKIKKFNRAEVLAEAINLHNEPAALRNYLNITIRAAEDKGYDGILDNEILIGFIGISKSLEASDEYLSIATKYNAALWEVVKDYLYTDKQYSLALLTIITKTPTLTSILSKDSIEQYFSHISPDTWLRTWYEDCLKCILSREGLTKEKAEFYTENQTEIGWSLSRIANDDLIQYISAHTSSDNAILLAREYLRNILCKGGSFQDQRALRELLIKRPDIIIQLNNILEFFIQDLPPKFHEFRYYDQCFKTNITLLSKCKSLDNINSAIYAIRVAQGTKEELINYLNIAKKPKLDVLEFIFNTLKLSPYEVMQDPLIKPSGAAHCLVMSLSR
jgi:hypothetical protein